MLAVGWPEEYGGRGLSQSEQLIRYEEALLAGAPTPFVTLNTVGPAIMSRGTDEQKKRFLPGIASGELHFAIGYTEPGAGTDVLGMKTNARHDSDAGGWVLNGSKMWITNGTLTGKETGDIFLLYARTGEGRGDITQFVIEKGMEGFNLGQKIEDKLGMRASMTAELVFENVLVPDDNVVGDVNGANLCMMRNLEIERIALAAMALGIARRCIDSMKQYAAERSAFGKDLYSFGQIQKSIAESYAEYMAGRCYVYGLCNGLDLNTYGNGLDADGVKLYCAPMAKNVADRAIQVLGGYGYVGEYNVERLFRDAKLLEIGGGTNESHHKNMSRDLKRSSDTKLD